MAGKLPTDIESEDTFGIMDNSLPEGGPMAGEGEVSAPLADMDGMVPSEPSVPSVSSCEAADALATSEAETEAAAGAASGGFADMAPEIWSDAGTTVVRPRGDLTGPAAEELRQALLAALTGGGQICLDLSAVADLDVPGLSVIVAFAAMAMDGAGGGLAIAGASGGVGDLLGAARLDRTYGVVFR